MSIEERAQELLAGDRELARYTHIHIAGDIIQLLDSESRQLIGTMQDGAALSACHKYDDSRVGRVIALKLNTKWKLYTRLLGQVGHLMEVHHIGIASIEE